ncbi:MAG TPA: AAA family ATPase [Chloroflexi bacterium]|nr:AAA family ATPase [Chloroflexota bacterium]
MRLLRLYIHEHRVLKELDIRFDPARRYDQSEADARDVFKRNFHLDFLVGVNGTGKSTVLRLLARIFSQSFAELRDLPFILEYYRQKDDQTIRIANIALQEKTPLDRFAITQVSGLNGDLDAQEPGYADALDSALLPERIIAYTTGAESEWFSLAGGNPFAQSIPEAIQDLNAQERSLQELPGWSPAAVEEEQGGEAPRLRFIWQEQLPLVALAGLLLHSAQANSPLGKVLQEAKIQRLAGFSLQFNLSYSSSIERAAIWQIFGQHASRAIRSGGTLLLVFQPQEFAPVLEASGGALALFERLADWQRRETPLLVKVNLFLERTQENESGNPTPPPLHTWEWLSDGERSFIGRMCLFMLFGEVESLILLDEPEVHFNDYWKRYIVSIMNEIFEKKAAKNHVLVATHSSISLTDVPPEDILVLERQDLFTGQMKTPTMKTFGADPGEIMVHVFGTGHASGEYSVKQVEDWLSEAYQKPEENRGVYLKGLLGKVAPGYWAYRIRREMVGLSLQ